MNVMQAERELDWYHAAARAGNQTIWRMIASTPDDRMNDRQRESLRVGAPAFFDNVAAGLRAALDKSVGEADLAAIGRVVAAVGTVRAEAAAWGASPDLSWADAVERPWADLLSAVTHARPGAPPASQGLPTSRGWFRGERQ